MLDTMKEIQTLDIFLTKQELYHIANWVPDHSIAVEIGKAYRGCIRSKGSRQFI